MTAVVQRKVKPEEDGLRLDRWFARHFPQLTHGRLEKLLRTGQVRIDGTRVKANHRVADGQTVRVPPLPEKRPRGAIYPQRARREWRFAV